MNDPIIDEKTYSIGDKVVLNDRVCEITDWQIGKYMRSDDHRSYIYMVREIDTAVCDIVRGSHLRSYSEVEEMTLAQVCEALGKTVKIIK